MAKEKLTLAGLLGMIAALAVASGALDEAASAGPAGFGSMQLTYADQLLTGEDGVQGSVLRVGTEWVHVQELLYGTCEEGVLKLAYLSGIASGGEQIFMDGLAECSYIFDSYEDVRGVYVSRPDGTLVWADHVVFGKRPDGRLSMMSYSGLRGLVGGASFGPSLNDPIPLCNTAADEVDCIPGGQDPCGHQNGCNSPVREDGQIVCSCPSPGDCVPQYTQVCPSNGLCPTETSCQNDPQDPAKCKCLNGG
jgi:hypothetical protein